MSTVAVLANGARGACDVYAATIIWDGSPRRVVTRAADTTPLVGMTLLHRFRLRMDVMAGGEVVIAALP